jgi:hypothetical protein
MDRRYRPSLCVRCGRRPRTADTYLCSACLQDPEARREAAEVLRMGRDYLTQRRVAIEVYHWAGGWGRVD